ncbi:MAG: hypothetical protein ABSF88_08375 [Candidatus Aminicenantales bacterium]
MNRIPGLAVSLLLLGLGSAACAPKSEDPEKIPPSPAAQIALKPDFPFRGKIIFQSDADGDDDIYRMTSGGIRKLTANSWSDQYPRWSPDGTRIAFSANPGGRFGIFVMNEDGSGIKAIVDSPSDATEPAWSPDGKYIAFCSSLQHFPNQGRWSLFLVKVESRRVIPLFSGFERILFPDWH